MWPLSLSGAASSQEQLAVAAQNAVSTIVQLAEVVKFGAASLGSNNPEAQVTNKLIELKYCIYFIIMFKQRFISYDLG